MCTSRWATGCFSNYSLTANIMSLGVRIRSWPGVSMGLSGYYSVWATWPTALSCLPGLGYTQYFMCPCFGHSMGTQLRPTHFPCPRLVDGRAPSRPVRVHDYRTTLMDGLPVRQALVEWADGGLADASWEPVETLGRKYPDFHLEDKVQLEPGRDDTSSDQVDEEVVHFYYKIAEPFPIADSPPLYALSQISSSAKTSSPKIR
ncbi:unnamed protein product [Cuscuta campestris]|uniref:Chromo domain-containing protein n=1 Tax=Cuscuta campestris TaxID=132261 RepID=A0A484L0H2_9ASTE|nr:unnamed protein product [Cuscuta campestris]